MEKEMENEVETVVLWGLYKDPCIQIIHTLGPKVRTFYLHWGYLDP